MTETSTLDKSAELWALDASYQTTGGFGKLDGGYVKHCAPTAIVNVLLSLDHRNPTRAGQKIVPEQAFRRIVSYGLHKHYYFNSDRFRFFGGTLNLVTKAYLKTALRMYGREDFKLGIFRPAWPFFLRRALDKGALLYLILVRHPAYGNHHAIAYGYRYRRDEKGKKRFFLVAADGWSAEPKEIPAKGMLLSSFFPVYHDPEKSLQK
ncbi:MAG: hypothetical protein IJR00_07175 [Lachnospiraceae bacterium]|nr:hypothetical protein [Lachnospiraceae bacterium]